MNEPKKIKVFLAYPEKILLEGLKGLLTETLNLQIVGGASCGNDLIKQVSNFKPDILLLSSKMLRNEKNLITQVRKAHTSVRIILAVHKMIQGAQQEGFYLSGISSLIAYTMDIRSLSEVIERVMEQNLFISADVVALLAPIETEASHPTEEVGFKLNAATLTDSESGWYTTIA
jgi:DNA-binding NarL/FixJ family response regulator